MKKFGLLITLFITSNLFSQTLLIEENFDYSIGDLTTVSANWTESPTGSVDIEVISGNLTYTNYPSSGIGNKIVLDGGASGRSGVLRTFSSQSGNGNKLYVSFIIRVTSTTDMDIITSGGERFFNLKITGSSASRTVIFVRQGSTASKFQIGLGKLNTSTPIWHSTELDLNTEYLIVVAYIFQSGDDAARLWIDPSLAGPEPTADLEQITGSDASSLGDVQFRQGAKSGDMEIDGLRVSDDWSLAPLPVELSSFSAVIVNEGIKLNWRTETEVSNYGFEVEKTSPFPPPYQGGGGEAGGGWEMIGFVEGYGNSNSPKEYSFVDKNITGGKYSYRLKQIDNDGKFEYSKVIEIDVGTPIEYELSQNYPNPFNPSTTIRFSIPEKGNVKLMVYNTLGEEVAILINEVKEAGVHTINFNATELKSGIYFYKFESGNILEVKKMILVR